VSLDLSDEFNELVTRQIKSFMGWLATEWVVSARDRNDEAFREHSDDYINGYNAALTGLDGALACWLEEYP
jgi:hypothetical protein